MSLLMSYDIALSVLLYCKTATVKLNSCSLPSFLQTSPGSGSGRDFHFYLDKGNSFHTPTYFEFSVPYDNPDLYGDFLLEAVMERFPVIGVSGASSK